MTSTDLHSTAQFDWDSYQRLRVPVYSDGTGEVKEGDHIRYHQAPGGLMPPGDWRYGVAARAPYRPPFDEICLMEDGHYYQLFGHVIEKVLPDESGEPK